ncbi:MAG: pantoate--beta-alanine ligase [Deltaproteobacteria bacterium RIFCSPLOWO2_12_FULL_43_16]|nr:MAG: pantoate--beta-alanine ligase [Deltaproteobacteria bacterium GWA2_43_19]OGQ09812.1 MAG: pantoate--beta-alanine ligase [Deltaproteobacteria bacterium RIFCSPHIGHO2_02_FULL_43_33]OGQ35153.1 MAG: pantoate--beta-alanine ligase [Deltaproteobacteria bacterium RIFCSPLOWO2_01_FULL_42_9]OGQ58335.1 MAG: pantoate--beta-alanine ligase [Deltaproteobacteria bacterium RIFCSPLOWO2_12_FULL_43_16]HBR18017.1 pantoate--beta-alanine ligase [Deltaproteobacteria bacterium]
MKLITTIREMQSFSSDVKSSGKTITFVPTMGFLHDGHASLLKKGREVGDILVMGIFVNPTQFGPKEDYASYPRDLKKDLVVAEANKVDVVFNPTAEEIYPTGFQTYIDVEHLSKYLCGISRPGHFRGVATVVAKLFNIVMPDIAIFGEKDFQQLVVIKRMVRDLNMEVNIIDMPIVRESDGLAKSSRNSYLNMDERKAALCLCNALIKGKGIFNNGIKDANTILKEARNIIETEPLAVIDYIKVCDINTLEDLEKITDRALLAVAVKIGGNRLIDNCILG